MKNIAIIGSGQAGLLAAHDLLRHGYRVTLYSNRSAEDWLHRSRPTGTAARFDMALNYERELGLNYWEDAAPKGRGVHLTFSQKDKNTLITLAGKLTDSCFQAVDLRLQSHQWMLDFEKKGGKLVIENIDVDRLDAIAQENNLTLVATGRGPLAELFPRNKALSVYDTPQRKLMMVIVAGTTLGFKEVPYLPVKFNFFAKYGEAFWVPYYHRDHGPCWCLIFEAKEGERMDQFDDCNTGDTIVKRAKKVIKELIPQDYEWCKNMRLADEQGWLKGAVTPTVRTPFGKLPSGQIVMPLGDTAISLDPIAGQGANLGSKYVRHTVQSILAHNGAYDEQWMQQNFEAFWTNHGSATVKFNNALLEPLTTAGKLLLVSQYGSTGNAETGNQKLANAIVENFRDPRSLSKAFFSAREAKKAITAITGKPWRTVFFRSLLQVIKGQFRQAIGLAPKHPLSLPTELIINSPASHVEAS